MYERLNHCPLCGNETFSTFKIIQDHSVSGESFAIVQCAKCSFVFTNPRPDNDNLSRYYKSDNYISHTNKANSVINLLYKLVRIYSIRQKIKLVQGLTDRRSILDFGCGTGQFLEGCSAVNWEIHGIEPDPEARSLAKKVTNITIHPSLPDLPKNLSFDIITAWHVLEHVPDLKETMRQLKGMLNTGGSLVLALPNYRSFDGTYHGEFWAGYDVPRHLYHFDKTSIEYLASKLKLKLVQVRPMIFDSYYVSMLSEKYKNQKTRFISSLVTGFKSNKLAKSSGEYSSLIYILKR